MQGFFFYILWQLPVIRIFSLVVVETSTNEQINFTLPPDMARYKANYFICSLSGFYDVFIEQQQQQQQ